MGEVRFLGHLCFLKMYGGHFFFKKESFLTLDASKLATVFAWTHFQDPPFCGFLRTMRILRIMSIMMMSAP